MFELMEKGTNYSADNHQNRTKSSGERKRDKRFCVRGVHDTAAFSRLIGYEEMTNGDKKFGTAARRNIAADFAEFRDTLLFEKRTKN